MQPSIFSKKELEPIRTKEIMTCGITNIPLSYPARLFFIHSTDDIKTIDSLYNILESYSINFERQDIMSSNMTLISSIGYIQSKIIKQMFRNFRTLRPKLYSDYRYCFWEIDTKDYNIVEKILEVYDFLNLPVYLHESMNGYHFVSVKPILKEKYSWFINQVRDTNPKYPPITLRILPNKYVAEENTFYNGKIISKSFHNDTERIKYMIEHKEIDKIGQNYQIVWYSFDKKQEVIVN